MTMAIPGIDPGKTVCSLVGLDDTGAVVLRGRMRRTTVIAYVARLPACLVAMEACCGAHLLDRLLADQGRTVRLISPEYVRPHVKAQKNDDRDAEAIAEAASRPTMRFVELKSGAQLEMQTLHRVRSRLVGARRTLLNQPRAILFERGHASARGRRVLGLAAEEMLADPEAALSPRLREPVTEIRAEWRDLDRRIAALNTEFTARVREDEAARQLVTIPGIGGLNATALVAAIGDGSAFRRGRGPGAWLGLVPKQHTTGGRPRLLGITRRGNACLRMPFIQGARAAMASLAKSASPLGAWLRGLPARAHRNVAIVARANKLARVAWAVLRGRGSLDLSRGVAAA